MSIHSLLRSAHWSMDLVHYDVIVWGSLSGAKHCAFCSRQHFVVPPLSHVKRPELFWVSRKIWLYHKLAIAIQGSG